VRVIRLTLVLSVAAIVLVLASLQRTEGAATSPPPRVSVSILAKAKEWFYRFQSGKIDSSQLAPIMRNQLTPASVLQEEKVLKACGKPITFEYVNSSLLGESTVYVFDLTFRSNMIIEELAIYPDHSISGIDFQLFKKRPPAAPLERQDQVHTQVHIMW
jgi:hypothetical protein